MAGQHVLLWYVSRLLLLGVALSKYFRLLGMGVPNHPAPSAHAVGKVLGNLYHSVGLYSGMLCRSVEFWRSGSHSILLGHLRSCSYSGICFANVPSMAILSCVVWFPANRSQWWTKKEQGQRTGIWFSFNGVGQIIGGLIAYGIAVGTREHGSSIEPWKIIFLATGLFTICLGFYFLYLIPDNQLNARWLSPEDRILAVERVRVNQQGIGNKHFKLYQFKEALLDPMVWGFVFYALVADIPNGGITNFFSQLVRISCFPQVTLLLTHTDRQFRLQ